MNWRISLINGPNLNMLGIREPEIYGKSSLADIEKEIKILAQQQGAEIDFFQSNHEGKIVDYIQEARGHFNCILINAGALSHYSIAIHDALKAVNIPVVEIHLSNIYARESFRQQSLISPLAVGGVFGFGVLSYKMAFLAACEFLAAGQKGKE
ncbi:MAG: type II 3-dehydroquinate dehydratase [Syntrophomonas sp.]|uniref:type II 3-dehydroquinate dehydratase n=1 Tax=Syntrophomonas sp. TaxID=2053627 RepID=UPI002638E4C2|nr:type II 3-dehydroquinate dehydratase [Syntrophomonas sp.]MDD2510234.1 type II 3-dehydroquinate dehydratase [Syntrophomonas sp.]MDD3878792.1 type II 3-dehydroquinate dehydratase [Syntrophomonas sp.]MDD4626818.1 type II 3-dehydroquinate dehydratase [Syntrophomonas sp.]